MSFVGKSQAWSRLSAAFSLLCYLLAGVSFSLPAKQANAHCEMTHAEHKPETLQPGAACPHMSKISGHHSHHQPHAQQPNQNSHTKHDCPICDNEQSAPQIVVCPQGCCFLHPEGGEITSIAKFLFDPAMLVALQGTCKKTSETPPSIAPDPFRAPPERPPAVPFLV
jgi:hypothetical protein